MLRISIAKIITMLVVCLSALYFALPSLLPSTYTEKFAKFLPNSKVSLGLDLRGGASLTLEVDSDLYFKEQIQNVSDLLYRELRKSDLKSKIRDISIKNTIKERAIIIRFADITQDSTKLNIEQMQSKKINQKQAQIQQEQVVKTVSKLVANLSGYSELIVATEKEDCSNDGKITANSKDFNNRAYEAEVVKVVFPESLLEDMNAKLISQSIEIIMRRVDESGTKEIDIQRQGSNQILLQVPGIYDTAVIRRILGRTAKLTIHLVYGLHRGVSRDAAHGGAVTRGGGERLPVGVILLPLAELRAERQKPQDNNIQEDGEIEHNSERYRSKQHKSAEPRLIAVTAKPAMMGNMLVDAQASMQNGQYVVFFKLNNVGSKIFAELTMKNVGKALAIVLDDQIISAPVINEPILTGSGVISGSFDMQSANELAILLRAGALPAPLKIVEERTVGPTLGQESIDSGTHAVIIASLAVMVFMLVFYSFWGVFANLALIINIVMIVAILGVIGATLTLPGLAGIALTLGMAVDANVLIYERMRDGYRRGATVLSAIEEGYRVSLVTIVDSNLTTMGAALILYIFGSGAVKGFAVSLSIGLLCSMFTSISLTKVMVAIWYRTVRPNKLWL